MEIHNQSIQGNRPTPASEDKLKVDVTRLSRERVQQTVYDTVEKLRDATRPVTTNREADRLELSEEAQRLARQATREDAQGEKRAERVRELKSAYEARTLNTRERLQKAAGRMLAGD